MNIIQLDAALTSDLSWEISQEKNQTFWHLDFGWEKTLLEPFNSAHFNGYLLALEEFVRRAPFAPKIILARNDGHFKKLFASSELLETRCKESGLKEEIFFAELFSEYLHRLISVLPEEVLPYILFDISSEQNFAAMVIQLCARRFEHFHFLFSDLEIPVQGSAFVGIALPQDDLYQAEMFAPVFSKLEKENISYKCIPEELLNEYWDGLEHLIVHPNLLSETGKRMLCGFEAAGGEVLSMKSKDFLSKIVKINRSRGI